MTDPLQPLPMTPSEIADLVERTRNAWRRTKSARAAQYAYERRTTLAAAARRFGVDHECVRGRFIRLYPGVPRRLADRIKRPQ